MASWKSFSAFAGGSSGGRSSETASGGALKMAATRRRSAAGSEVEQPGDVGDALRELHAARPVQELAALRAVDVGGGERRGGEPGE
jgi:hypothetical protein